MKRVIESKQRQASARQHSCGGGAAGAMTAWQGRRANGDPWLRLLSMAFSIVSLTFLRTHPHHAQAAPATTLATTSRPGRLSSTTRAAQKPANDLRRPRSRRQLSGRTLLCRRDERDKARPLWNQGRPRCGDTGPVHGRRVFRGHRGNDDATTRHQE